MTKSIIEMLGDARRILISHDHFFENQARLYLLTEHRLVASYLTAVMERLEKQQDDLK